MATRRDLMTCITRSKEAAQRAQKRKTKKPSNRDDDRCMSTRLGADLAAGPPMSLAWEQERRRQRAAGHRDDTRPERQESLGMERRQHREQEQGMTSGSTKAGERESASMGIEP